MTRLDPRRAAFGWRESLLGIGAVIFLAACLVAFALLGSALMLWLTR